MTDQPSNSRDDDDYFGPFSCTTPQPSIEEYLEYSEEAGGYILPKVPSKWDKFYWAARKEEEEEARREAAIPPHDLQSPRGVFELSPAKRKSHKAKREQLPLFPDDDVVVAQDDDDQDDDVEDQDDDVEDQDDDVEDQDDDVEDQAE